MVGGALLYWGSEDVLTSPICCVVSNRMGVVSSKKQVKEKGKGHWSPVKVSTQSKDPPPLPPLVSDGYSQLGREGEEEEQRARAAPSGLLLVSSQPSAISRNFRALTNRPPATATKHGTPLSCWCGSIVERLAARLPVFTWICCVLWSSLLNSPMPQFLHL